MNEIDSATPWSTGLLVAAFATALAAVAAFAFAAALMRVHPALAIVLNVVAVGGAAPTIWRWRSKPVVRWIVYGVAVGIGLGWFALIVASV